MFTCRLRGRLGLFIEEITMQSEIGSDRQSEALTRETVTRTAFPSEPDTLRSS